MLTELHIRDLGVIADAMIELDPGMTVITGETGAGKTMIVSGIGMLLGQRGDAAVVRSGCDRALVEGRFTGTARIAQTIAEIGGEIDEGELIVARQISSKGRSRAAVGGAQTPLARLVEVTGELVTIHGQSEQVRLGSPARQREVLDLAGGEQLATVLETHRSLFMRRARLIAQRDDLVNNARARAQRADMLRFGLDEIEAIDPQIGEDEALGAEAARLQEVDELRLLASQAARALTGADDGDPDEPGAMGLVGVARKAIEQIAHLDETQPEFAVLAQDVLQQVNDLALRAVEYRDGLEADPIRLEAVMERRARLAGLFRKYGANIAEVLTWAEQARTELDGLTDDDARLAEIDEQIGRLGEQLASAGAELTGLRKQAADRLTARVQEELAALAMPHARLEFSLEPTEEPTAWGMEQVHLLFAANPGSQMQPLAKVASGGELSRVRLALEVVLAAGDPGHVFVFDEVDAGVGGEVGVEIGRRLAALAHNSQVIVVTHLAQVAAFAGTHWVVAKSSTGQVTTSDLRCLDEAGREAELARMMGGLVDSASGLQHARDLLTMAAADR